MMGDACRYSACVRLVSNQQTVRLATSAPDLLSGVRVIPTVCSYRFMDRWRNLVAQQTLNLTVLGSNPRRSTHTLHVAGTA